ncbi:MULTISPECIES: copper resistance CopC family protein [Actinoplanes]|uniref:copper resistance CopC family protein n=1 Tax=Actinoplanes TaxID=1865 RepID=UPI0006973FD7|nr:MULTISPECIES: copper resistance CopC family protein [Actinoplanes]GLY00488.1 hypothetical protein Acsp01_08670 [Actinoplanes sp. NBRC 101535]
MNRRTRLLIAAVLVSAPLAVLLATTGRPEPIRLLGSSPADTQVVPGRVTAITLELSADADPAASHITVTDRAGREMPSGPLTAGAGHILTMPVTVSGSTTYQAAYHVVGATGAPASGVIRFAVDGRAAGASGSAGAAPGSTDAGAATAGHEHSHGVDPVSAILLLANLVAVLVAGFLLARRPAVPAHRTSGDDPGPESRPLAGVPEGRRSAWTYREPEGEPPDGR